MVSLPYIIVTLPGWYVASMQSGVLVIPDASGIESTWFWVCYFNHKVNQKRNKKTCLLGIDLDKDLKHVSFRFIWTKTKKLSHTWHAPYVMHHKQLVHNCTRILCCLQIEVQNHSTIKNEQIMTIEQVVTMKYCGLVILYFFCYLRKC